VCVVDTFPAAHADDRPQVATGGKADSVGVVRSDAAADDRGDIRPAALTQPAAQPQPAEPIRPQVAVPAGSERAAALFGPSDAARNLLTQERRERSNKPASDVVLGSESATRTSTDAASLLGKSQSTSGVAAQKRTPIVTDPRVRGQRSGQLLASGSSWVFARQDLDTLLSKIDSSIISDLIVIKGPYAARYGPGFSFIDVQFMPSPRYDGPEWHGRTSANFQTNGEQWSGRQSLFGGSTDWGLRVGYGHRTGSDYDDGDGENIPSSYKSRDVDVALGFDLSEHSRIEISYLRLDQTGVEFPGQIFDIEFLVTDAYKFRYELDDSMCFDQLSVEGWYNRTRFEGNAQRHGKRRQIPELQCPPAPAPCFSGAPVGAGGVLGFIGFTDVDSMSTGYRIAGTWGDPECGQLTIGTDLRYTEQELYEFDSFQFEVGAGSGIFIPTTNVNFPIPRSHQSNPGLFAEYSMPVDDCLTINAGSRLDWVSANLEGDTRGRSRAVLRGILDPNPRDGEQPVFDQDFALAAAFVSAEYKMNDCVTATAGFGHAERPPTLTELYAVDPFLAILQQGFSTVRGNPELDPELLWQVDLGFRSDFGNFRGAVSGFYAWVNDYITYEALGTLVGVPDALVVRFVNTDWATLSGGEISGEYDLCQHWTSFATLSYVEGRDHSHGVRGIGVFRQSGEEPLPGIAPLESRLGVRLHEPSEKPRWGIELTARVVDNQDRVASSLLERETPGFTTFDLRSYWQATDTLLLVAGVENFADKDYREHLDLRTGRGVRQPGVNSYFGFELSF